MTAKKFEPNVNVEIRPTKFQLSLRGLLIATPLVALLLVGIINFFIDKDTGVFNSGQPEFADVSPFSAIRWENGDPFVCVVGYEGEWYQLLEFNEISIDQMISFCNFRNWDARKRVSQDIVQLACLMNGEAKRTATLCLRNKSGQNMTLLNVRMTQDARKQCVHPFSAGAPDYPAWSPFVDVRWVDDKFQVRLPDDQDWYELVSIHGETLDSIQVICEDNGWASKRRVKEDLPQLLRLMGHDIEKTTSLKLRNKDGGMLVLDDVRMSEENLNQLLSKQTE